jgi:hypothetical protein
VKPYSIFFHQNGTYFLNKTRISVRVPNRPLPLNEKKNIQSPSNEPQADGRSTYIGVWVGSLVGSLTILLQLTQDHANFSMIPSTLTSVDQSPLASVCFRNPQQGKMSISVTASHVTQGEVEYESTLPCGTIKGWSYGRLRIPIRALAFVFYISFVLCS